MMSTSAGRITRKEQRTQIALAANVAQFIEPKVFFSNERTYLKWMHTATMLGSFGLLCIRASSSQVPSSSSSSSTHSIFTPKLIGVGMMGVACLFIIWAMTVYYIRARNVRLVREGPYEFPLGPVAAAIFVCGALVSITLPDLFL